MIMLSFIAMIILFYHNLYSLFSDPFDHFFIHDKLYHFYSHLSYPDLYQFYQAIDNHFGFFLILDIVFYLYLSSDCLHYLA